MIIVQAFSFGFRVFDSGFGIGVYGCGSRFGACEGPCLCTLRSSLFHANLGCWVRMALGTWGVLETARKSPP